MSCPYKTFPSSQFFSRQSAVGATSFVTGGVPDICVGDSIASYGSCFATRVAKYIRESHYHYWRNERVDYANDVLNEFSSSVGNVYSIAQFNSLLEFALDLRPLEDGIFVLRDGIKAIQLLRGRAGEAEAASKAVEDFRVALLAFRDSIAEARMLVLTLGLTEVWQDTETGVVLPTCPGCGWGEYSQRFQPVNLEYRDVSSLLADVEEKVAYLNPNSQVVYTISPVPLVATFNNESAITANFSSKATQLVAVRDWIRRKNQGSSIGCRSFYFPSFEIVTNPFCIDENFGANRRQVTEAAERQVMTVFFDWLSGAADVPSRSTLEATTHQPPASFDESSSLFSGADVCDEEYYWRHRSDQQ